MKNTTILRHVRLLAATACLTCQCSIFAGGPIGLCATGTPILWPSGGTGIPFNPDLGPLGPLDNASAITQVQAAFSVWQSVPSATATYVNAGNLPVDVTIDNFVPFLAPQAPDGFSAIVFDSTGEIFDLLFGPGSGILGFAGPEWINLDDCSVMEGVAFLNGPSFADSIAALDVMVHEFGHYSGLGHSVVNGQIIIGDSSGPSPDPTFGFPGLGDVETMYPFYFGPESGMSTLNKDDINAISELYPESSFDLGSATISGTIRTSAAIPLTGVNVIARNIANPFEDAVSAISGDYSTVPGDPEVGRFVLRGLTPGAEYAIYIDQILAGGFSTPLAFPFPGLEEFYSGAAESDNISTPDPVLSYATVSAPAGGTVSGVDIIFNRPKPGEPIPLGDDGSFDLPLPFNFVMYGQTFSSVSINANGNLTFGTPDFSPVSSGAALLGGPPRIAALWTDLDPSAGGIVTYSSTPKRFSVRWSDVPEFAINNKNSFEIVLTHNQQIELHYGRVEAQFGVAGISGGGLVASTFESPVDLSVLGTKRISLTHEAAVFESFGPGNPFDIANRVLTTSLTGDFRDRMGEPNNTLFHRRKVSLPFDSKSVSRYTEIEPAGNDVDYFRFNLKAGDVFIGRVLSGAIDSLIGLFYVTGTREAPVGTLVAIDDDSGQGTLSTIAFRVPVSGEYALAVTTFPDFSFVGAGGGAGRYVLDLQAVPANPNNPILNGSFEFGFVGWEARENGSPFIPWQVSATGSGSGFDLAPTQPQDGSMVAWNGFDGEGPMTYTLRQDVTLRPDATTGTLRWRERLQWNYFVGSQTRPRTYQVQLRDPSTDAVLAVLFDYNTGIEPGIGDTGWLEHSADISAYIGSSIRLHFEEFIPEAFTGPGQFEIDAISIALE